MRTKSLLLLIFAPTLIVPLASGCMFLSAPPLDPPYPPVPTPAGIVFNPEDGVSHGTALNKAGDPALPDAFRAALVLSGNQLVLQSVKTVGTKKTLGAPDTSNPVRLAGILTPRAGQAGFEEAKKTVTAWTLNQDLDVEVDTKYPTDIGGTRMVQVFFKGRPSTNPNKPNPNADKIFSLNRMMVRSGYAIVDLNSPTSFDQKEWLYDESYARIRNLGLWPTGVFRILQQRLPEAAVRRATPKSNVAIAPAPAAAAPGAPGAPAMPGAPAAGVPAPGVPPTTKAPA